MDKSQKLTICSVYHSPETKRFLELNYELTKKLNPEVDFEWVVADGREPGTEGEMDHKKFNLIKGVNSRDIPGIAGDSLLKKFIVTYCHGLSLNNTIQNINSRFVLFLDCDFYILRKNWISEVVEFMKTENLSFFGSPFHPKHFQKYRYFPCVQAFFVDIERVGKENIDFSPQYQKNISLGGRIHKKLLKIIFRGRCRIGGSRDANYGVYQKYFWNKSYKFESLIPVFNIEEEFLGPKSALYPLNRLIEIFLPERFCYLPKNTASYAHSSLYDGAKFQTRGIAMKKYILEEYLWKNDFFGFHLRGVSKRVRRNQINLEDTFASLEKELNLFT